MNLFRKIAASITLVALVVSTGVTGVSAYSSAELTAANGLASANVINDHAASPADYNFASLLLRSEAAKIAVNLDSTVSMKTTCDNSFADVTATTPNTWTCGYAEALLDAGKVSANTNFNPLSNLTKSEATKMFLEAAGCTDVYTSAANWQAETVAFAADNNIIPSYTDYNTPATRGFVFEVAYNAMNTCPVEEVACDSVMEALGICTVDTTDTTTDTTTGSTDTTGTVNNDSFTLNDATPADGDLPSGVSGVEVMKFDITAGSSDLTVNSLTLKRVGLGASSAVTSAVLFADNARISKAKTFNSATDLAEINITPSLVVMAGETKTVTVKVATGTSGKFALSIDSINASADLDTSNVVSSKFELVSITPTTVTVESDGTVTDPKLGEEQADLLKFKITNGGEANEDVELSSITFKDAESNIDTDVENITLYYNNVAVATVPTVYGKYVTFNMATPVTIKEDKTEKFVIKGDIVDGASDFIDLYIDNILDVTVYSPKNKYAKIVVAPSVAALAKLTVQAGQVTVLDTDPVNTDVLDNKKNVSFGTFEVQATSGKDLYVDSVAYTLDITNNGNLLNADLENVELYDATNGVTYDPNTQVGANNQQTFNFTDLDLPINKGSSITFEIRADILNGATTNDKIAASVDIANGVVVKEALNDKSVTDKIPSAVSFKDVQIVAADMKINALVESNTNQVVGSKDVDAFKFEVRADNDASDLNIRELTIKGTVVDSAVPAAGTAVLDNTRVNALYLYDGDTLLDSKSASELANGEVTFDGLNIIVNKNSARTLTVKLDVLDDSNNANDTINLAVAGYYVEDSESDNVYVSNDSNGILGDAVNGDTAPVVSSNRTITIQGVGTLAIVTDNTDTEVDKDKNVIAGATSDFVASYELTSVNEGINIIDLEIDQTNGAVNLQAAVSEVVLYANDKTTEIARQIVTSDVVKFNNINYVAEEGSSNVYVKVVTHKIGKDEAGTQTADLTLKLKVTDAEGANSAKTIAGLPLVTTANSKKFTVVPVAISNVAFVASNGGETVSTSLTNGENTLGIIAITTDASDNTNSVDGSALKTLLKEFKVTLNTDAKFDDNTANAADITAITVEKIGGVTSATSVTDGAGNALPATSTGGTAVTDINLFKNVALGTDEEVDNSTTVYFVVKATFGGLDSTENKYAQLKLENLDTAGTVVYSSDDSAAIDITSLRIGDTSIDGTTLSSNY